MMANGARSSVPKPRVVVGLDFGTTFSGFAYAHTADPEMIYTYFDYPKASGEKPYCKTLTASYYKRTDAGDWELKSWGYPARVDYERDIQAVRKQRGSSTVGKYLSRYKLHLASKEMGETVSASPLPVPVEQVITDYLREMGALILKHIQDKYGAHFTKELIQWCVTVPSIWDNAGKATMKSAMTAAGLLDASPHPLVIVLEPEAASFHCHKLIREQMLHVGDKLLVADVGGGTSDIVVQELVSVGDRYSVKEVTTSSGGLCGGTYIDARFMEFLHRKIGPCLPDCVATHPNLYAQLIRSWEYTKTNFGTHLCHSIDIDVPNRLATEWERYERESGLPARQSYDEVEITYSEMQSIFDPVVEQNLELISSQLTQADEELQILVVVGGFAESPYLLDAIRRRFATRVGHVISPPNPGSAVCQGAVALALNPATLVSRVCKRTYGFENYDFFEKEVDPPEYLEVIDGVEYCINRFRVLARKGDQLKADDCFSEICCPRYGHGEKFVRFRLFSSDEPNPRYVVGGSVKPEGEFFMDVSGRMELGKDRKLKVSLFFGGSSLEVKAEAVNFWAQKVEIPVEVDYLLS